jgi:hypothetical protein
MPMTRPLKRTVPETPDAMPDRSREITVMPTLVVSPLSRPAPIPASSIPSISGP